MSFLIAYNALYKVRFNALYMLLGTFNLTDKKTKMKILNLYAGIGGNRTLWGNEHEITAIEINSDIASQSQKKSDFNKLQGLKHRYEAQHEGQKGFKSGIVKAVDNQLKNEQDRPFSTFRKKKKPQVETERLMTVDEDTWEIKDIEFSS